MAQCCYILSLWCVASRLVILLHVFSGGIKGLAKELLEELAGSVPGIDEAKSFVEVIR